jgi:hypothetical protein
MVSPREGDPCRLEVLGSWAAWFVQRDLPRGKTGFSTKSAILFRKVKSNRVNCHAGKTSSKGGVVYFKTDQVATDELSCRVGSSDRQSLFWSEISYNKPPPLCLR